MYFPRSCTMYLYNLCTCPSPRSILYNNFQPRINFDYKMLLVLWIYNKHNGNHIIIVCTQIMMFAFSYNCTEMYTTTITHTHIYLSYVHKYLYTLLKDLDKIIWFELSDLTRQISITRLLLAGCVVLDDSLFFTSCIQCVQFSCALVYRIHIILAYIQVVHYKQY